MKRIAIVGWEEGLAGQVNSWIESINDNKVICFVHPFKNFPIIDKKKALKRPAKKFSIPENGSYLGKPFISGLNWIDKLNELEIDDIVISNSNIIERVTIANQIESKRFPLAPVIHPSAQILRDAVIGKGCVIEPLTYIGYRSEIEDFVHVHTGAKIDHHSVIKSFVNIFSGSIIAGNVQIGKYSSINLGAIIANRIEIGEHCTVGAGSTVLESFVKSNQKLLGTPAQPFPKLNK